MTVPHRHSFHLDWDRRIEACACGSTFATYRDDLTHNLHLYVDGQFAGSVTPKPFPARSRFRVYASPAQGRTAADFGERVYSTEYEARQALRAALTSVEAMP